MLFDNFFTFWQFIFLSIAGVKKKKEHIGQKIKRIRGFKGINQEQLAKSIGKTRSLISHFERTGNINKYTLLEIADALGVDAGEFEKDFPLADMHKLEDSEQKIHSENSTCKEMVEKQKDEIGFLKDTISHQWQLLHELAKKK